MSSVPWIRLYTSFSRHRKTMALRRILGTAETIVGLWCWAAENAPDGDLSSFTENEIEEVTGWTGERGKAFKAMVEVGFIDNVSADVSANKYTLHQWSEHAGLGISSYMRRKTSQRVLMKQRRSSSGSRSEEDQKEKREGEGEVSNLKAPMLALTSALTKKRKSRASLAEPSDAFNKFWKAYPKKTGKGKAMKAWPGDEMLDVILEALAWQVTTWDPQFTKHPATWLNARCWEDEKTQPSLFQKSRDPSIGHYSAPPNHPMKTGRIELP
jgi:hypothetical protein